MYPPVAFSQLIQEIGAYVEDWSPEQLSLLVISSPLRGLGVKSDYAHSYCGGVYSSD